MNQVYVYVIGRERGPVKVGITASLGGRLAILQTGCPFKLTLFHAHAARNRDHAIWHEQSFHESYAEDRLIGEWFKLDAELAIEGVETSFEIEEWYAEKARRTA